MKKLFYSKLIILILMFAILIPGIVARHTSESTNDNVTISLLYNDLEKRVSTTQLDDIVKEYLDNGISTISVMEEDLNYYDKKGTALITQYHSFRKQFDEESTAINNAILNFCPNINPNSYVIVATDEHVKEQMEKVFPQKYKSQEYHDLGAFGDAHAYVIYDGSKEKWEYCFGYNEEDIEKLYDMGFEVALVYRVKNYSVLKYLDEIENLIEKYDIKYLNLKENTVKMSEGEKIIEGNYAKFADMINDNDMTLVVTENTDQLSNQKFLGYSHVFDSVMSEEGSKKVMRSLETYDETHAGDVYYERRVEQFINSTIDRNIRFITVTQLNPEKKDVKTASDYTLKSAVIYKNRIEKLGFRINDKINAFDYNVNTKLGSAACAVIMLICLLYMYEMITKKRKSVLNIIVIILSAIAFVLTFKMPPVLLALYPTAFCVVQSCMAMTCLLYFIKETKLRLSLTLPCSLIVMLAVLLLGAVGMGTMLSGVDYYFNNSIFRGIKISLIVPILYTAIAYYFMFLKKKNSLLLDDIKLVFNAQIKVYWLIIAVAVLGVGVYYIIRSGNVTTISSAEQLLRSTVSELFPARPRTKEFLIGYPCLLLLIYYAKTTDCKLVNWILAIGTSILAASITNSFCHVFTDFEVIVRRTLNGLIIGIIFGIIVYALNLILVKIIKHVNSHYSKTEMK